MRKKKEAVGKYLADALRTTGVALSLFSGLGLALGRPEALNNLPVTITFAVLGGVMVIIGAVIVLTSTLDD